MTFRNYLEDLDFDRLVRLWNEYCFGSDGSAGDAIYESIEGLNDNGICTGIELTRAVFFGEVHGWYDKVSFNGYGNLYSVYSVESSPIDISYLAKWLKEEEHEVYQEWMGYIEESDFAEWLIRYLTDEDLAKLWDEYVDETDDIADLAGELMADQHQVFKDFIDSNI